MKFTAAITAAVLAFSVHAEESPAAAEEPSPTSSSIEVPTFTPTTLKSSTGFIEQFTDGWEERWKPSHAKKETSATDEEWAYVGEWAVEEPYVYKGMEGDKGLVVKDKAAHHAISAKLPKKIDNTDKTLVVQYEVKLQKGLECGGAYMKLLRENKALHQEEFSNTTPYVIMFGPDKCGSTNKVHFIFNHKNPKTGEYEEKHLEAAPIATIAKTTELYTLLVHPNNTFTIQKNHDTVREGSLLDQFKPSVNPPEEIDDPEDTKPEDWVDEARIPDPDAKKPEDWDEDAPYEIVDEEATKPEDWLEKEPLTVPDPEAEKPEDWDDEEDGDWIPPTVPNPKCADVSGCGPWTKPMIKNPEYKGKWTAPYIDNPAYKGPWAPRKIKNPDYFEDKTPANFEPIGALGFEIWTMQNDIMFDNIYVGHSIEEANQLAAETFDKKHPVEKALEEAEKPKKDDKPKSPSDLRFLDDPVEYVKEKVDLFLTIAANDPIQAMKFVPEVPTAIGGLVIAVVALIGILTAGGSAPAASAKTAAAEVKDTAAKAKGNAAEAKDTAAKAEDNAAEAVYRRRERET